MLSTDAYAFLNIKNRSCAWAAYRGVLVSTKALGDQPGFVSPFWASRLFESEFSKLSHEYLLEDSRKRNFPERISRLTGLYCFISIQDAEKAANIWGSNGNNHFRPEFLAELHLGGTTGRDRLDSNWITFHRPGIKWMENYWRGEPYPHRDPIWETLVEGRVVVLGTELRERAYKVVKHHFPASLCLLEISRIAACIDSDLGNVSNFLHQDDDEIVLKSLMDMRDAKNHDFLNRLGEYLKTGHPINRADISPHFEKDSFGRMPDMRKFGFRRPIKDISNMAYPRL